MGRASLTLALTVGVVSATYYLWTYWRKRSFIPTKWTEAGVLSDIMMYPIKSCGYIKLKTAECTPLGLRTEHLRDRCLMIVNEESNFVSARTYPKLLSVTTSAVGDQVTVTAPHMEPLHLDLKHAERHGEKLTAYVWSQPVTVANCGEKAAQWFSKLGLDSADGWRLVYHYNYNSMRPCRGAIRQVVMADDSGAFPDLSSYNLINESSISDLNSRLAENGHSVVAECFRPNFVLRGSPPLAEDGWKWVKIGDNIFEVIKPCQRCVLTTIDPETGVKDVSGEPLATLRKYRRSQDPLFLKKFGSSPMMGIHLALRSKPTPSPPPIALNQTVYVA